MRSFSLEINDHSFKVVIRICTILRVHVRIIQWCGTRLRRFGWFLHILFSFSRWFSWCYSFFIEIIVCRITVAWSFEKSDLGNKLIRVSDDNPPWDWKRAINSKSSNSAKPFFQRCLRYRSIEDRRGSILGINSEFIIFWRLTMLSISNDKNFRVSTSYFFSPFPRLRVHTMSSNPSGDWFAFSSGLSSLSPTLFVSDLPASVRIYQFYQFTRFSSHCYSVRDFPTFDFDSIFRRYKLEFDDPFFLLEVLLGVVRKLAAATTNYRVLV